MIPAYINRKLAIDVRRRVDKDLPPNTDVIAYLPGMAFKILSD